jgi:hypothetical protein
MVNVETTVSISKEQIANALCSAIEAGPTHGCGYWGVADQEASTRPEKMDLSECGDVFGNEEYWYVHWPLFEGGKLVFIEHDGYEGFDDDGNRKWVEVARHTLDLEAIQRGLKVLADKFPHKFAELVNDESDGPLGDLFLQCCFFGEEKYA